MPVRRFGLGIRDRADLAPAAFVGTLCNTLPRMLDASDDHGVVLTGFMPQLELTLGAGSFDAGNGDARFRTLLASNCRLAQAFAVSWAQLQAELGREPDGVLRPDAAGAGAGVPRMQRAITSQRETVRFQKLDVAIRALAANDVLRHAWIHADSFSTAWVTCWPSQDAYLSNAEFGEVATRYMGLPSPACKILTGSPIASGNSVLDRYGFTLSALPLTGDGWREQHDSILWRLAEDMREMGLPVRPDVYGMFAACIPQSGRQLFDQMPARKRQGLVPDFLVRTQWNGRGPVRDVLLELKTLHFGTSTYPTAAQGRCTAVAKRAARLPAEYTSKARQVDVRHCGTRRGEIGPVERRLRTYDAVKGLVFGAFGEASADVHVLLSATAAVGADRHYRSMLARDPEDARGAVAWLLKRRWGVTAVRAAARLTLGRLELVGRGAGAAASRRHEANGLAAQARRSSCWERRGPR